MLPGQGGLHEHVYRFLHVGILTRDDVRRTLFEYIEVDYNRNRRQSTNSYGSPEVFEAQLVA